MITYRKGLKKDKAQIEDLINSLFGSGYAQSKTFFSNTSILWVAEEQNKVIGVAHAKLNNEEYLLDIIGVEKRHQNKGIGKSLFQHRLNSIPSTFNIILNHWVRSSNPTPKTAMQFGFKLKDTIVNYWKDQSQELGYECRECEKLPCQCTCEIYLLKKASSN